MADKNPTTRNTGGATQAPKRRRRLDGEVSRTKILDAATEIAAERGYEGTSIGLVSARCGLPASSIYWHFKDKDDLIAAVIERSFTHWLASWQMPPDGSARERTIGLMRRTASALLESPDFLRLGLMLALERRPVEPRARAMFLDARAQAHAVLVAACGGAYPGLTNAQLQSLVTYALACADGLFIASEIGGDSVDLLALFEMHAGAVDATATRLLAANAG